MNARRGPIGVLYATREGHTRHVAEHVAAALRTQGFSVVVADVGSDELGVLVAGLGLAICLASVHAGKHEPEMAAFVRAHRAALEAVPSAFVSVSLTEATAEDDAAAPEKREEARRAVAGIIDAFLAETGWKPDRVLPVAGCVAYTQYGLLKRLVMKSIVRAAGGPLDTSRDHVLTDWEALDVFVDDLVGHAERHGAKIAVALDRTG